MSESRQTLDLDYEEGKQVCGNCGHRGYEHEKERVTHLDGTYSYDYLCPEGGEN